MENIQQNQNVTRETLNPGDAGYWAAKKEAFRLIENNGLDISLAEDGYENLMECSTDEEYDEGVKWNEILRAKITQLENELKANPQVMEIYKALGYEAAGFCFDPYNHPDLFPQFHAQLAIDYADVT